MSWLDNLNASRSTMISVANQLDYVSDLLFQVGLEKLAVRLEEQSNRLRLAEENINTTIGAKLDEDMRGAVNNSFNLFAATLAGAAIESKDEKRMEQARILISKDNA
jgi:hypothetical protein